MGDFKASLVAHTVKNLPAMQETWVGKIPWRRTWQPTLVLLSGEPHGQRSLAGYSPWGHKESDMTERPTFLLSSVCQCIFDTGDSKINNIFAPNFRIPPFR